MKAETPRRSFLRVPDRWRKWVGWVAGVATVLSLLLGAAAYRNAKDREEFQKKCDVIAMQQCRERGEKLMIAAMNFYPGPVPPGWVLWEPDIAVKRAIPVTQSAK